MNNNIIKILVLSVSIFMVTILSSSAQVYYVFGDERVPEEKLLTDSLRNSSGYDTLDAYRAISQCIDFCVDYDDHVKATGSLANLCMLSTEMKFLSGVARSLQRLEKVAEKYNLPGALLQSKLLTANECIRHGNLDSAFLIYSQAEHYLEDKKDDVSLAKLYIRMSIVFGVKGDNNMSTRCILRAINLVEGPVHDAELQSEAWYRASLIYVETEEFEKAKIYVKYAIPICEVSQFHEREIKCHLVYGYCYLKQSKPNYTQAYGEYDKVLTLLDKYNISDPYYTAKAYNGMGIVLYKQGKQVEGMEYLRKSLELRLQVGNMVDLADSYISIARYYQDHKMMDSAIVYYESAFTAAFKRRYEKYIVETSRELARCYAYFSTQPNHWEKAFKYQRIAYEIVDDSTNNHDARSLFSAEFENQIAKERIINEDRLRISHEAEEKSRLAARLSYVVALVFMISLVVVFILLRKKRRKNQQLREQKEELNQQKEELKQNAETLARQNAELEKLSLVARQTDNSIFLTDADGKIIWLNEAFTRHSGYNIEDYLDAYQSSLIKASSNTDIEKVMDRIRITKEPITYTSKTHNKAGEEIWIQTTLSPSLDANGNIAMFIAVCSDITDLKHAQEKIAVQNKEINESLEYARKIQEDIQAPKMFVDYVLGDYFVVNFPKNIVSGDFHWVAFKDNKTLFSLADCTGHGIPGGFMSMIEQVMLNNVLHEVNDVTSANILNKLRERNIRLLHQRGRSIDSQDGMDASLFVFDREKMVLNYAAGYSIAYLLRFGTPDEDTIRRADEYKCTIMEKDDHSAYLIKLRPNRFPVGGHPKDHIPFTDLFFNVNDGDIVYTSSDGYLDQFGGPVGKKYSTLAFERTIFQVCELPLSQQQEIFSRNFLEWRGDHEQTDDVHVFATKLKNNF